MDSDRSGTTILVGIDGSAGSQMATRWAIEEAELWHTEVEALYAWHLAAMAYGAPGFVPPTREEIESAGQNVLEQVLAGIDGGAEAKPQLRVIDGRPADVIRRVAGEPQVGLVVVGSRGHGAITDLVLGSVSHELSHRCPKPVVIVPRARQARPGPRARVVVGVDGSSESVVALEWAATEALVRQARLEVVTVWTSAGGVRSAGSEPGQSGETVLRRAAEDVSDRALVTLDRPELQSKAIVASGPPAAVLIEQASDADMLVLGTRGVGQVREALFGSVGHACVHHSHVPVVIVPNSG